MEEQFGLSGVGRRTMEPKLDVVCLPLQGAASLDALALTACNGVGGGNSHSGGGRAAASAATDSGNGGGGAHTQTRTDMTNMYEPFAPGRGSVHKYQSGLVRGSAPASNANVQSAAINSSFSSTVSASCSGDSTHKTVQFPCEMSWTVRSLLFPPRICLCLPASRFRRPPPSSPVLLTHVYNVYTYL